MLIMLYYIEDYQTAIAILLYHNIWHIAIILLFDVYSSGYGLSLSVSYYCIYYMRHAAIDLLAR